MEMVPIEMNFSGDMHQNCCHNSFVYSIVQLALYNLRHNIRLTYNNVIVFTANASDIDLAPSSPMELSLRL